MKSRGADVCYGLNTRGPLNQDHGLDRLKCKWLFVLFFKFFLNNYFPTSAALQDKFLKV